MMSKKYLSMLLGGTLTYMVVSLLLMSLIVGVALFLLTCVFGEKYLRSCNPAESVLVLARGYLSFMRFTILLLPMQTLLGAVVYSDSVVEAHNKDNELYGDDRLKGMLDSTRDLPDSTRDLPGEQVLERIRAAGTLHREAGYGQAQALILKNVTRRNPHKITSFNPLIVTKDAEATIALFEALGFERRHMKTGSSKSTMMVSPSGFSISIAEHIKNHD